MNLENFKSLLESYASDILSRDNTEDKKVRTQERDDLAKAVSNNDSWFGSVITLGGEVAKTFSLLMMVSGGDVKETQELFKHKSFNEALISVLYLGYLLGKKAQQTETLNAMMGDLNV